MGDIGWVLIAVVGAAMVAGLWALFRSFRRWQQAPPGSSKDSLAAESELWSTHNMDI